MHIPLSTAMLFSVAIGLVFFGWILEDFDKEPDAHMSWVAAYKIIIRPIWLGCTGLGIIFILMSWAQ